MLSTNNINSSYEFYCMPSNWTVSGKSETLQNFVDTLESESAAVSENFYCDFDKRYGDGENEKVDFIYPRGVKANSVGLPIVVYFHGGYWEEGSRQLHRCLAKPYHAHDKVILAIVGYDLCSQTIKLPNIEAQCVRSMEFIHNKFPSSKLILVGHSAGGYLAAAMLTYSHLSAFIHALVSLAGFADVEFLTRTSISKALVLDKLEEQNLLRRKFFLNESQKVFVLNAQRDSPLILVESLKLFDKVKMENFNVQVKFEVLENEDHFTMILNSLQPESHITKCILDIVNELNEVYSVS